MSSFSHLERQVSGFLGKAPHLKKLLKTFYQRLNFIVHGERDFSVALAEGVTLSTPSQLIESDEPAETTAEFFGYFDASPWPPDGRYYVVNQVSDPEGEAEIVLYDLAGKTRKKIGSTPAWTWQQGAMPRWLSVGGVTRLAYNALNDNVLGTRICAESGEELAFLPLPLQAVNIPFGKIYAINYLRLHKNGTEYGYSLSATNFSSNMAAQEDGIWSFDLESGEIALIVSLGELLGRNPRADMDDAGHEVNHISVAPDGERFVFMHRWRGSRGQFSRLYLTRHDGTGLALLLDEDMVSHYAWLGSRTIIAWARTHAAGDRYYLLDVSGRETRPFPNDAANRWGDGHPTFHASDGLIVTDTYPDRKRQQRLFIFDPEGNFFREIGRFLLPTAFTGDKRVDLHPRWSPKGGVISIDAGFCELRRNYILDFSASKHTA